MTQTPLEEEEAAATVAAGADLAAPSPAPAEPKSYQAEPWVEPEGSRPPPEGLTTANDPSLRARLARAPLMAMGVAAGSLLVGAGLTLMAARRLRRAHPLARLRRR
ncbi:hypothetical protein [Brevundimonas sp.]|uniref:hypothetical protein n=1 Tax=Brevundimonas sp. TaxID=1871086 RepID=UPI0035B04EE1